MECCVRSIILWLIIKIDTSSLSTFLAGNVGIAVYICHGWIPGNICYHGFGWDGVYKGRDVSSLDSTPKRNNQIVFFLTNNGMYNHSLSLLTGTITITIGSALLAGASRQC